MATMFTEKSANQGSTEDHQPTSDSLPRAIETFQAVRNRLVRMALQFLPWIILTVVIIAFEASDLISAASTTTTAGIAMYSSGMIAVALGLLAFQILMQRIPETLGTLWSRNIITSRSTTASSGTKETLDPHVQSLPSILLQEQYQTFVHDVEESMNHRGQWAMGMFFALLVVSWAITYPTIRSLSFMGFIVLIGLGIEFLIALVVGLMVWRMVVVGVQIWRLGSTFEMTPRLGHPDGCGGLEPLGNLCLWNALIISLAGIYLGGWIILGPSTPYRSLAVSYTPLFTKLLLVPLGIAAITFLLPLWSVHQVMVAKRSRMQLQLDQLGQIISELQREMLERVGQLQEGESEKMAKKLEWMQQVYERGTHYPVWPFNVRTLVKFGTSQAIPLLGLTGLGQPLANAIKSILDFLNRI